MSWILLGHVVFGAVLGYCFYAASTTLLEEVSWSWRCRPDDAKKVAYRYAYWSCIFLGIGLWMLFGRPALRSFDEHMKAERAAYEASLRKVTVVVTDVESVPNVHDVRELVGVLVLTEEYPRHKIFIPFRYDGLKSVAVGDMLDLKLDGWTVVEAGYGETMPVPHGK